MNHERSTSQALEHEQALLAHFRAHSAGEPSAEVEARILAAAGASGPERAPQVRPGWSQRLHQWLFGSGRQRWSVAVAGLACVGIGVSLSWRTLEQAPEAFDAAPPAALMAPAAPVAAQGAQQSEGLARQSAAPAAAKREQEALRMHSAPLMADTPAEEPAALAELVAKAEPRDSLLRLLELRRSDEREAAAALLAQLRADYPQLDIEAELARLAAQVER